VDDDVASRGDVCDPREPRVAPGLIEELSKLDGQELTRWLRKREAGRWIFPANLTHTLIGTPGLAEDLKTFVEPGGSFSPGVGTYGITFWIYDRDQNQLYAAETYQSEDLSFGLAEGYLPVVKTSWQAGNTGVDCQVCTGWQGNDQLAANDYAQITVKNDGYVSQNLWLYVAVRSLGPAGGPIDQISYDENVRTIWVNGDPAVQLDRPPEAFGACAFQDEEDDISLWASRGEIPKAVKASAPLGLASGAARFAAKLKPGAEFAVGVRAAVKGSPLSGTLDPGDASAMLTRVKEWWHDTLDQVDLILPGPFSREVFKASIGYLLNLSVADQVRVSSVSYPSTYVRDGVYIINAIDKAGLHDTARRYIEYLVAHPWSGAASQQGPEADAPGELLWIISEHFRLTRDKEWLRSVYSTLYRLAELICFLRHPVDGETREFAGLKMVVKGNEVFAEMDTTLRDMPLHFEVLLARAEDGVIFGRIDLAYDPHWLVMPMAVAGLQGMAEAAEALGEKEDAQRFRSEAATARHDYEQYCRVEHPSTSSVVWPCRSVDPTLPHMSDLTRPGSYAQTLVPLSQEFDPKMSLSNKYINFGAAHNLLFLGHQENAVQSLEALRKSPMYQESLQAHAYAEVTKEESWYEVRHWPELWSHVRGWFNLGFNLPHGWCSAELALLLRDMVVYEDEGQLRLGEGFTIDRLVEGEVVGAREMPTYYGNLTYRLVRGGNRLSIDLDEQASPPRGFTLYVGQNVAVRRLGVSDQEKTMVAVDGRIPLTPGITELCIVGD
jgi:hypothetical protein